MHNDRVVLALSEEAILTKSGGRERRASDSSRRQMCTSLSLQINFYKLCKFIYSIIFFARLLLSLILLSDNVYYCYPITRLEIFIILFNLSIIERETCTRSLRIGNLQDDTSIRQSSNSERRRFSTIVWGAWIATWERQDYELYLLNYKLFFNILHTLLIFQPVILLKYANKKYLINLTKTKIFIIYIYFNWNLIHWNKLINNLLFE